MPAPSQQRQLPFLHRNWVAGITAFQEGVSAKTTPRLAQRQRTQRTQRTKRRDATSASSRDEHARPAKRRRTGPSANNISSDLCDALGALRLPEEPDGRVHDLRVQVLHVLHKDTPRLRFGSTATASSGAAADGTATVDARVKVSLLTEQCGVPQMLCCAAQVGAVHTDKDARRRGAARGLARLAVAPFTVPLEQMAVVDAETGVFGLAEQYTMRIELEATSSHAAAWPPLNMRMPSVPVSSTTTTAAVARPRTATGGRFTKSLDTAANLAKLPTPPPPPPPHPETPTPPRTDLCILFAEIDDIFARPRMRIPLWLRESPKHAPVCTDYVLDVALRWSTGFVEQPPDLLQLDTLPSIVALHPDEPLPTPGESDRSERLPWRRQRHGRRLRDTVEDSNADDDLDLEQDAVVAAGVLEAPKRVPSMRTALTNGTNGSTMDLDEPSVPVPAVEKVSFVYPPEELIVDGFVCCMCMAACADIVQLRAHLMVHWKYHFALDVRPASRTSGSGHDNGPDDAISGCRYLFSVSRVHGDDDDDDDDDDDGWPLRPAVFQLGRPRRPLDLARYVDGDRSWVVERYGPEHGQEVVLPLQRVVAKPLLPTSKSSSSSSSSSSQRGALHDNKSKNNKQLLVPHTKQKLFDPLSKALLVPGSVLRQPAVAVDDSWRMHKHREIVQDYTDLTAAEKEFIQEWDGFLVGHRIASDAYIPAAMVQFVQEKGAWLMADRARSMEFGKLMAVLLARDVLVDDEQHVDRIVRAMNQARVTAAAAAAAASKAAGGRSKQQIEQPPPRREAPPSPPPRRDPFGCQLCGRRCAGPDMLVCSNLDCTRRLYHRSCVGATAIVGVQHRHEWYCNACAHLADPAHLVRPLGGGVEC